MGARKKKVKKTTPARKLPPRGPDGRFKSKKQKKPKLSGWDKAAKAARALFGLSKPATSPKARKGSKRAGVVAPRRPTRPASSAKKKKTGWDKAAEKAHKRYAAGGWYTPAPKPPSRRQERAFHQAAVGRIDELEEKESSGERLTENDAVLAKMLEAESASGLDKIIRDIIASGDWGDYESDELYDLFYGYGDD